MISARLKNLFGLSVLLFVAHGTEEIAMGFATIDSHVAFVFGALITFPPIQGLFIFFQITLWILLIVTYLLMKGDRWHLVAVILMGVAFVYELHHVYKVIDVAGYYPGIITAIPLYIVGFFYWRELIKNFANRPDYAIK